MGTSAGVEVVLVNDGVTVGVELDGGVDSGVAVFAGN